MWTKSDLDHVEGKEGELRAWHISKLLSTPIPSYTHRRVDSPEQAVGVLGRRAQLDLRDNNVEWNTQGLVVWEFGEWTEWYSQDGEDIDGYAEKLRIATEPQNSEPEKTL